MSAEPVPEDLWHRILVLAPLGRDADLICNVFTDAGIEAYRCSDAAEICRELARGAGAVLVTEEALDQNLMNCLGQGLADQPPWSDMPVMILTGQPTAGPAKPRSLSQLGRRASITLVDRPVRMKTLVTTAESVLRFRERQYEIRELMDKLEERIHERDRFLAILGHELRNPLGAILLASQMTREDGSLEDEYVVRIERQARHLTRLVNDLLDLSRVTSGKIVLRRSLVNLTDVIQQAVQTVRPMIAEQKLDLQFSPSPEPVYVDGDATRLEQIVSNVVTNAMKYTPEGGRIEITTAVNRSEVVMKVSDTGVGIAPERLGMIFELFGQAENAIGRSQGGMGIGLALVRNLVELHGGSVNAQSDGVGKGSVFTVRFPVATAEQIAGQERHRPEVRRMTDKHDRPRRIVVVEDNNDVRDLLRLKLKRLGHHVEAAADGPSGLEKVLKERPDIAFIDIGLPGIDGYEVAQRVRSELGLSITLVALSGFGLPEDKRKAIESGFDQHLTKPVELHDVESVLTRRKDPKDVT